MTLKEVNFYVIKAIFSLPNIKDNDVDNDNATTKADGASVLQNLCQVLKCFRPIITNYIKTEDSMLDCLKAIEECLKQQQSLKEKAAQVIHYFYDKEIISEDDAEDDEDLSEESQWLKKNLQKLVEWLREEEDEESSEDE